MFLSVAIMIINIYLCTYKYIYIYLFTHLDFATRHPISPCYQSFLIPYSHPPPPLSLSLSLSLSLPHKDNTSYFLRNISKMVDANIRKYENVLLIGDFNADIKDHAMSEFCEMYNLKNLINEPTCYKNSNNLSSIDAILTNRKRSFESSMAIETGLSDHHKMIITVLKSNYKKRDPLLVNYRSYKKFDENLFRNELVNTLENLIGGKIWVMMNLKMFL